MENGFLNGLKSILRDKDFNERGSLPISYSSHVVACAVGSSLWLSVPPPPRKQPLWVQPFLYIYSVVFSSLGNVSCMIQTLIYIYSCNTVNVTKKASL